MIQIEPLTAEAFAPFGDVIRLKPAPDKLINQGHCGRHHDLATLSAVEGRVGISLFDAKAITLPYSLEMMERHPLGSQAFLPMQRAEFLVVVAEDHMNTPGTPRAFIAPDGVGVNYHAKVWHGVLAPLVPMVFAVVDRIGLGSNLEEHWFETPISVKKP